ncbi:MAG: endonuclease domain-containing protein [Clostridiales bacterium]|nr:endonuclease domain-containing protein [Clostridiales bacterium]
MDRKHNPFLTPYARELRKNMTKEERRLWYDFLRNSPVKFSRQKVLGKYIVDFYSAKLKLVIELDGSQHFKDEGQNHDARRDAYLKAYGLTILRIPNNEINNNFDGVCEYLQTQIDKYNISPCKRETN